MTAPSLRMCSTCQSTVGLAASLCESETSNTSSRRRFAQGKFHLLFGRERLGPGHLPLAGLLRFHHGDEGVEDRAAGIAAIHFADPDRRVVGESEQLARPAPDGGGRCMGTRWRTAVEGWDEGGHEILRRKFRWIY